MGPQKKNLARDVPPTVDRRLWANGFQAAVILAWASAGAIAGYFLVDDGRWYAAAAGGVLGMVLGAFASGLALMFAPQSRQWIKAEASEKKYRTIRRRYRLAAYFSLAWGGLGVGWLALSLPANSWTAALWGLPMLLCYILLQYDRRQLELWRCPNCDRRFGHRGLFANSPHTCRHCGFAVDHRNAF